MDWTSKELIQHVYGYSLESLHGDAEDMYQRLSLAKSKFQRAEQAHGHVSLEDGTIDLDEKDSVHVHDREKQMRSEHVNCRLSSGKYYQVCKHDGEGNPESRLIFQVICKHPERRSYVQRVCFLGKDVSLRINDGWFNIRIFVFILSAFGHLLISKTTLS